MFRLIFYFLIKIIILNKVSSMCEKDKPFLKNGICSETKCTDTEISDETCIIDNDILKTQWITNLITLSPVKYSNIDIFNTTNQDLIIETSPYPGNNKILFYGFKSNGRQYYENQTYHITTTYDRNDAFNTILNFNNKDYIISICGKDGMTELFDIEQNLIVFSKSTKELFGENIYSTRNTLIELLSDESGIKYHVFAYISQDSDNSTYLVIQKLQMSFSNNELKVNLGNSFKQSSSNFQTASCFQAENSIISCLYPYGGYNTIMAIGLNNQFTIVARSVLIRSPTEENIFIKCILFQKNVGVYAYIGPGVTDNTFSLIVWVMKVDTASLINAIPHTTNVVSNNIDQNIDYKSSDLIKINDLRFCVASTSQNNNKIYLTCFYVDKNDTYIYLNEFSINITQLYDFKIFQDIRIQLFNNFIILGINYCNGDSCSSTDDQYYSGLIFLSYPNSTDILYDVVYNFCENDEFIYNNITFDLLDQIKIENNLFGYVLDSIKITKIPDNTIFKITSSLNGDVISENKELNNKTSVIKLEFIGIDYTNSNYILEFVGIADSLKFNDSIKYMDYAEQSNEEIYEEDEANKKYYGRTGYLTIYFKNIKNDNCKNSETTIFFEESNEYAIQYRKENIYKILKVNITKENFEDIEEIEEEINKEEIKEEEIREENIEEEKIEEKEENEEEEIEEEEVKDTVQSSLEDDEDIECTVAQILNNKCKSSDIGDNQINDIYENLKDKVSQWNSSEDNTIIETNNVIFQISSLDDQKNTKLNLSYVDLGECENILKNAYGISSQQSLIILKTDIISNDTNGRYVQYEIYNPNNYEKLDLSLCKNIKIEINIPVTLDSETESAYDNAKNQGYNLFDSEDDFYNELCTPYTSENDTDLTLAYRQNYLYKSLCQDGCVFNEYNQDNDRVSCNCDAQTNSTKTSLSNIEFYSSFLFNSFFNTIKISNFMVMKCYKLFFSFKDLFKNVGKILMFLLYLVYIVLMIICLIKKDKLLLNFMMTILNYKFHIYNPNINLQKKQLDVNNKMSQSIKKSLSKSCKSSRSIKTSRTNKSKNKKGKKKSVNEGKNSIKSKKDYNPPIRKKCEDKKKLKTENHYINANINIISLKPKVRKEKKSNESSRIALNRSTLKVLDKSKVDKKEESSLFNKLAYSKNDQKNNSQKIIEKQKQLNNYEFNYLDYKKAIALDNRTIFTFYWNLLKEKQLILFAFLPENDYNLRYMKVLIFILSFSLYFTVNAFFFVDDTMDKINIYSGKFSILFNLPQIIYSSIITTVLTIILKNLALSMKNILSIKKSKNLKIAREKCKKIKKFLKTKFISFFIIGNILMLFFLYYISCFCSVYKNTQVILIKDTLLSFALSMLYPFGTCMIPGIFRFISLADKNKNRECLYKLSNLIIIFL